jgi:hypothetical protein
MEKRNRFAILGVAASIVGVLATAQPREAQSREGPRNGHRRHRHELSQ